MTLKIDKGVALTNASHISDLAATLKAMVAGDSVFVPNVTSSVMRQRVQRGLQIIGEDPNQIPYSFRAREEDGIVGVRFWKTN